MRVTLLQGPEGAPNSSFGLYRSLTATRQAAKELGVKRWSVMTDDELEKAGVSTDVQFIQSDWDYAGLASSLGWIPCKCGRTDGTVNCEHRTVSEMLSEAFDYLAERDGQTFDINF